MIIFPKKIFVVKYKEEVVDKFRNRRTAIDFINSKPIWERQDYKIDVTTK